MRQPIRLIVLAGLLVLGSHSAGAQEVYDEALFSGLQFRMVGPTRGGRVTTVAGHRDTPRTFYMGATGGGVWKTTDYGMSWKNISDGYFQTASIGSIDVADSDARIVYVGTGSDGIRSNVIIGRGIYKSTDGGDTWSFLGLRETGQIGAVVVHPTNPEIVYVAALGNPFGPNPERGVYRTVDGGVTWEQILFVSEYTGAIDLELNPANPEEIYAALWRAERKPWTIISGDDTEDGIYISTNGGNNWVKSERGLPQGLIGKIDLAVSPDDPSRVYALVETRPEEEGLYRSNDRGASWRLVNNARSLMTRPFYYTNVDADPTNADIIWVNNLGLHRSENAGVEFRRVSTPHGDNHDIWINPDTPSIMIQSNDGGANVTLDGGLTWTTQRNQPTAELYQIDVDDRFPYWVYAGQQDNTTIAVPSLPPDSRPGGPQAYWESIGGCETGPAVPRPGDANIVYSNCKGTFRRYNRSTGQQQHYYVGGVFLYGVDPSTLPYRFQRVVPIEVSPHNADVIYHGSQYVHRTTNEGRTWEIISSDLTAFRPERQMVSGGPITRDITGEEHYSTLYVIEVSPLDSTVIWTGANDGPVHVTRDGGAVWQDVTPADMPPEGRIQTIDPSPHVAGKAYVTGYRYLLGDFRPYIYRTTDYGRTWTRITNGIPDDTPARVVREDPDREGLLYAGTEFGLYVSFDDGGHWQSFQQGLPVVPITDIKVHRQDLVASTMGRSFWILDNVTPLHTLDATTASAERFLFTPRDAWRMRYSTSGGMHVEYLPPGAVIDYYFESDQESSVTLDILDAAGSAIRTFAADVPEPGASETQGMRAPPERRRSFDLAARSGGHRFVWNLRHEGPLDDADGRRRRGPMVPPGDYQVRLTSGSWSETRPLRVRIDPRVAADGVTIADLEAQRAFNLEVADQIDKAWLAIAKIDSALGEPGNANEMLSKIRALLVTDDSDSYPEPMLIDQFGYLYGFTTQGDHRPGRDAYQRLETLRGQLSEHLLTLHTLLKGDQ